MNEIEIMNAYARELKLASFKENAELYAQDAVREQWGLLAILEGYWRKK